MWVELSADIQVNNLCCLDFPGTVGFRAYLCPLLVPTSAAWLRNMVLVRGDRRRRTGLLYTVARAQGKHVNRMPGFHPYVFGNCPKIPTVVLAKKLDDSLGKMFQCFAFSVLVCTSRPPWIRRCTNSLICTYLHTWYAYDRMITMHFVWSHLVSVVTCGLQGRIWFL